MTGCIACSDPGVVDATKFTAVQAAAQSVRAEMHANGGGGSATCADRLRDLKAAIAAAGSHVVGRQEKAALSFYADAAHTYEYFLRFRDLEGDGVGGMVLLRGSNRPVALRHAISKNVVADDG